MMNGRLPARQRGAVLIIALILLVAVMILGVGMSSMSRTNLKIVGNNQSEQMRQAVAQLAVEQEMNDIANFTSPTGAVNITNTNGMQVAVGNRTCVRSAAATGYSAVAGLMPIDTIWGFTVTVTDPANMASTTMTQGTRIRMLSGNCP